MCQWILLTSLLESRPHEPLRATALPSTHIFKYGVQSPLGRLTDRNRFVKDPQFPELLALCFFGTSGSRAIDGGTRQKQLQCPIDMRTRFEARGGKGRSIRHDMRDLGELRRRARQVGSSG